MEAKDTESWEKRENNFDINWIKNAELCAEELALIKIRLRNQSGSKNQLNIDLTSSTCFAKDTELRGRINSYLKAESKSKKLASNSKYAAKLVTIDATSEKKLLIAIELAKSGYIICSLNLVVQLIKDNAVEKEARLHAFLIAMNHIVDAMKSAQIDSNISLGSKEILYYLIFAQRLVSAYRAALNSVESSFSYSSELILELLTLAAGDASPRLHREESAYICIAEERKQIIQRQSLTYKKPIIRTIHHLACTGGTLISKCLASMHNVALISEVNPLNRSGASFAPTNPLLLLERSYREFSTSERIDIFRSQVNQAYDICLSDDVDLIFRDHSHTDFHCGKSIAEVCPIRDSLTDIYELISVVTVRHPLDSYLSLIYNGWEKQFDPSDINEYSKRYLFFLEKYSKLPIVRYEDFCADPVNTMKSICGLLDLQYNEDFLNTFGDYKLSGDSGRSGTKSIEQRPRREIPESIVAAIENSRHYSNLVARLGY